MPRNRRRLLALLLLLLPATAYGQRCIEDVLCVETEERKGGVAFFVNNLHPDDLTVIFDVVAANLVSSVDFPYAATYPGRQRTHAFTMHQGDDRTGWRYTYTFWWRPAAADREHCEQELFCVITEERDAGLTLYVDNRQPFEVTLALDAALDNAEPDVVFPYVATFPPHRRTRAFEARRTDPFLGMQYRYTFQYRIGSIRARHDDAFAYRLPFASGKSHRLIQGNGGSFTHQGLHALDFAMPERTPVHAARGGVVAFVEDHYEDGGLEERFKQEANVITIRHDDGTLGSYVHLARNGAFVRVGQQVRQGQVLGVSGNTGYSSGPHLHFEVYTITEDMERRTLPVRFDLGEGRVAFLEEGRAYTAPLR